MVRILLVMNNPKRELEIMHRISDAIKELEPNSTILIIEGCAVNLFNYIRINKIDVVLTYPFTTKDDSYKYYHQNSFCKFNIN